uniref:Uncharacterized protein n=1 Tax=Amorphochlora amoebiformis TaxID=1561963 RepID=A0A7S0DGA1_9EUKA
MNPAASATAKTRGLAGDHLTSNRYVLDGSITTTARGSLSMWYTRRVPSVLQVRNKFRWNGEVAMAYTGPECFSKECFDACGYTCRGGGRAAKNAATSMSFVPVLLANFRKQLNTSYRDCVGST